MEYSDIPTSKISGSGRLTVPGHGVFKISGSGRISPELIKTSGSSKIPGGLKVGEVRTSGSSKIEGDIEAEFIKFNGSATVDGSVTCEDIASEGHVRFSGSIRVDGRVTAKSFEGRLGRKDSHIKEGIEADYIEIEPGMDNWRGEGYLVTSNIVGKDIILENVECDNVTGDKVTILPGCRIRGKIRYRESVKVDPGTKMESEPEKIE